MDGPADGHTLLKRCEDASEKVRKTDLNRRFTVVALAYRENLDFVISYTMHDYFRPKVNMRCMKKSKISKKD